jgi:hypothetical protein
MSAPKHPVLIIKGNHITLSSPSVSTPGFDAPHALFPGHRQKFWKFPNDYGVCAVVSPDNQWDVTLIEFSSGFPGGWRVEHTSKKLFFPSSSSLTAYLRSVAKRSKRLRPNSQAERIKRLRAATKVKK